MVLYYYALCQSRIKISKPEGDAVTLHSLQQDTVSGKERKTHAFGQGNINGIVDGDLVGPGDRIGFSQEVPRELVDLQVQVVKKLQCRRNIGLLGAGVIANGVRDFEKSEFWQNQP